MEEERWAGLPMVRAVREEDVFEYGRGAPAAFSQCQFSRTEQHSRLLP